MYDRWDVTYPAIKTFLWVEAAQFIQFSFAERYNLKQRICNPSTDYVIRVGLSKVSNLKAHVEVTV